MNIPDNINSNHIATVLLLLGFFLFITGIEIIRFKVKDITVSPGTKTWALGLFLIAFGLSIFIYNLSPDNLEKSILDKQTSSEVKKATSRQETPTKEVNKLQSNTQTKYENKAISNTKGTSNIDAYNIKTDDPQIKQQVQMNDNDLYSTNSEYITINNETNSQDPQDPTRWITDRLSNINPKNIPSTCVIDKTSFSELQKGKELLYKQKKYPESISYLINIRDTTEKECVRAKSQIYIGDAYKKMGMYPDAREQLTDAENYFRYIPSFIKELGTSLKTLGEVELKEKDQSKACLYLNEARSIFQEIYKFDTVEDIDGYLSGLDEC